MSYAVGKELVILLVCLVLMGVWLVMWRRGTPFMPLRAFLVYLLIFGGTWGIGFAHSGPARDYGVLFAAFVIALFQLPDRAPAPRVDLFKRIFTVLGAWWILYRT